MVTAVPIINVTINIFQENIIWVALTERSESSYNLMSRYINTVIYYKENHNLFCLFKTRLECVPKFSKQQENTNN